MPDLKDLRWPKDSRREAYEFLAWFWPQEEQWFKDHGQPIPRGRQKIHVESKRILCVALREEWKLSYPEIARLLKFHTHGAAMHHVRVATEKDREEARAYVRDFRLSRGTATVEGAAREER